MREYLTRKQLRDFSHNKIRRLQNRRFHATCSHLLPHVPFYKKLFKDHGVDPASLKKVEHWQEHGLPLVKKATYMKDPKSFIAQPDKPFGTHVKQLDTQLEYGHAIQLLFNPQKKDHLTDYYTPKMLVFSGGTESGNPTPVSLTATQKQETLPGIVDIIAELAFHHLKTDRTVAMNLFPYAPHLAWHATHIAFERNANLNLCTAAGGAIPTERLVHLAGETKPNIICGMSDYIRNRWLPVAIKKKITLPNDVLFINSAQKLHNAEREKITQLARKIGVKNAIVLDLYGASELKEALMPECIPHSGYHHLAPLSTIVRTVTVNRASKTLITDYDFSPNGHAASWNIDGAGTLLEGYFPGDHYSSVVETRCPHCELNVTRIYDVNRIRNVQAQLKLTGMVEEKVKGTRVNLSAYRDTALSLPEVKEAQVALKRKKKQVEVRIVSDKPAQAKKKLERAFAGAEIKPKIATSTLEKLQGTKIKFEPVVIE